MRKLNLTALLLGAALFTGLGVTSASAEGMKCGAGKCGSSMTKPVEAAGKCGASKKGVEKSAKFGAEEEGTMEPAKCGASKKGAEKSAKCGDAKSEAAPKCGHK
jgi:hypothetical protein